MKAAVFYGTHDIRVEEHAMPELGDDDVLVQVMACGVCGTDVHIYEGDPGAAPVKPPTILGHEFAGVIRQVGSNVTQYQVGDRVCVDPNCYCGNCDYCRDGIAHYCTDMIGYGTTRNGGFAEYCSVNQRQIYRLGEHTSFDQGAMTEPVACCLHGMEMCDIHSGSQVVVIGGGMIGLLMLQLAKLQGAARIVLIEPSENKRKMGMNLGADVVIHPFEECVQARLKEEGITQVDTVIECVGSTATIEQAIEIAGMKSTVMMFGLTKPDETISLKPYKIFQKEITLRASYINPYTQARALRLIDSGKIDVESMIAKIESLEALDGILGDASKRERGKFIIHPND